MKTILKEFRYEETVNKSAFITIFFPLFNKEDFFEKLKLIKTSFPGARHYCYGYRYGDFNKSSDDGEPTNTAGKPILKVLVEKGFNNCGIVVVRFFGGKLLGASNLLRTYLNCAIRVCQDAEYIDVLDGLLYEISDVSYQDFSILKNNENNLNYYFKNVVYGDTISFELLSQRDITQDLLNLLKHQLQINQVSNVQFITGGNIYVSK